MLFKKLIRTMLHYKAQFISMIIMMFLAVTCLVGINSEWYGMKYSSDQYYEETNLADYWAYKNNFTSEDIEILSKSFDQIERKTTMDITVLGDKTINVNIVEKNEISKCFIVEGKEFSDDEGIWLSDRFATKNGLKLGDNITVSFNGLSTKVKILGIIKSPEYVYCVEDESILIPDFDNYGYAYISADVIKKYMALPYTTLMIKSSLTKEEVRKIINDTNTIVISRAEFTNVNMLTEEINGNKLVALVFPWFFLLIAFLTMATTMTRITNNDRIQIGTLKALGFKNNKIIRHYSYFGLAVGIIGAIAGLLVGPLVIGTNLIKTQGGLYDVPYWKIHVRPIDIIIVIAMILLMLLATYLSCYKMLKGSASECLRERDPKIKKVNKIGKSKLWKKLPFYVSWNIRDIFRNKIRSIMTILGVMGCMGLLLCAIGFNDSIIRMSKTQYTDLNKYEYKITLAQNLSNDNISYIKEKYETSSINAIEILTENGYKTKSLEIYNVKEMIEFQDAKYKKMELKNDGIYLTDRLSKSFNLKVGDTVKWKIYGSSIEYTTIVAGITRAPISQGFQMTQEFAKQENINYKINTVYSNEKINDEFIGTIQTKNDVKKAFDDLMGTMKSIIYLLIAVAIVLGLVVLYNLGMLSYIERYRELSTLKVIGFNNQKINKIIITQNIWMAIIGIGLGIVLGNIILNIMVSVMPDSMDFSFFIKGLSYLICILSTLGVAILVNFMIFHKIKKIDMVASLKRE